MLAKLTKVLFEFTDESKAENTKIFYEIQYRILITVNLKITFYK